MYFQQLESCHCHNGYRIVTKRLKYEALHNFVTVNSSSALKHSSQLVTVMTSVTPSSEAARRNVLGSNVSQTGKGTKGFFLGGGEV